MSNEKNLIYILIGTGSKPLASYSQYTGEFIQTCEKYLPKVKNNSSSAINFGDFFIFYINQDNITYLLMTSPTYPKAAAIACIESLIKEFQLTLSEKNLENIKEYSLSEELQEKLQMKFDYYNEHPDASSELKSEIVNMKDDADEANKELLERNNNINSLQIKSKNLKESDNRYKSGAIKVKKSSCKAGILICIGIILALLIIGYVVICIVCSWDLKCK